MEFAYPECKKDYWNKMPKFLILINITIVNDHGILRTLCTTDVNHKDREGKYKTP